MKYLSSILLLLLGSLFLQGQELVKDIDKLKPIGSNPRPLAHIEDTLYFSTAFASELALWKMTVNTNDPILIKTFPPINFFYYIHRGISFKGKFYFTMEDDVHGEELWVSDGTEAGTKLFKNIASGNDSSDPSNFMVVGDYLYFLATNGDYDGFQLWVTDGTSTNTHTASPSSNFLSRWQVTSYSDGLLFTNGNGVLNRVNTALEVSTVMPIPEQIFNLSSIEGTNKFIFWTGNNSSIWINDGLDSMVNFFNYSNELNGLTNSYVYHDGAIVFAENLIFGVNIWKSDGTPEGNVLLKSFEAESFGGVYSSDIEVINNEIYFYISREGGGSLGGEVWKTDLTPDGTVYVDSNIDYSSKIVFDNKLFFSKLDDENGNELWTFDGNEALPIYNATGNCEIADINRFFAVDTTLFFVNDEGFTGSYELWNLNPFSQEALLVKDLNPAIYEEVNADPKSFTVFNDQMFFSAGGNYSISDDFWVTDGEEEGTEIFIEKQNVHNSYSLGDSILIYLLQDECTDEYTLWKTDGTNEGSSILYDFTNNNETLHNGYFSCFKFDEKAYLVTIGEYNISSGYVVYLLLETDGTNQGTHILHFITIYDDYCSPVGIIKYKDELYITNGSSTLRKINPATDEYVEIFQMDVPLFFIIGQLQVAGDYLYFIDCLGDKQLWRTDGTTENAIKLADQDFWPAGLEALSAYGQIGDFFLFKGKDEAGNYGIWGTNHTAAGTNLLTEIPAFDTWNALLTSELFEINGAYYFILQQENENSQLWTTDGSTSGGTYLVKTLAGTLGVDVQKINNKAFFTLNSEVYGIELWVTDGTYTGTKMVFDLNPGEASSAPRELTLLNDDVLFSATGATDERELWKFDILTGVVAPIKSANSYFEIYPNPVTYSDKEVYIKSSLDKRALADVKLYTIEGKLLSQVEEWLEPSIDNLVTLPANLQQGVYLLNLTIENKTTTLKFTLQ